MPLYYVIGFLLILLSELAFSQQKLELAKLKNLPDQFIGEYILEAAYKKLNMSLEFQLLPASRALQNSNKGLLDGEIQRVDLIDEKMPNLIKVPVVLNYVDSCFFFRKKMQYTGFDALKPYTLAYARGIVGFKPWLEHFGEKIPVNTFTQAFQMVDMARADMTISGCLMGAIQIKKLNLSNVFPLKPAVQRSDLFHYLHKKHQRLVSKITKVLKKMEKSGELELLREQAIKILLQQS